MERVWIIFLITCLLAWESTSITNKGRTFRDAGVLRKFRHAAEPAGNINTDWEVGLREAVNQALLRERYHEYNLRERLLEAPLTGRRDVVNPFGDIVVLARGQLYSTHGGNFLFVQDQYQNDCDDCHNPRPRCTRSHCQIQTWQPDENEQLVALWTVKRLRHRNPHHGHYYELEYTVSPITPAISDFVTRNGRFDYGIPGHIFVVRNDKPTTARPEPALVYNKPVPQHHFQPEVLIGITPDGEKYILHSYPGFYTSFPVHPTYHQNRYSTNDPREIALYKELIESLASKTSTTQKSEPGPHQFSLNTFTEPTKIPSTKPSYNFFPTSQSPKMEQPTRPLSVSTTSTVASSPVYTPQSTTTSHHTTTVIKPTKPTTDSTFTNVETTYPKDRIPQITRPVTTTVHYFTPIGEEDVLTDGMTTEMKKITLQTITTKKPLEQEEDGADFLFPEYKKSTTPSRTTQKYKPTTLGGLNFLEEPASSPTDTTKSYHTSTTRFKPETSRTTKKLSTVTTESTKTMPSFSVTENESSSTITKPSVTSRTTKSTTSKLPATTTTKTPKPTSTSVRTTTSRSTPQPSTSQSSTAKTTIRFVKPTLPGTTKTTQTKTSTSTSTTTYMSTPTASTSRSPPTKLTTRLVELTTPGILSTTEDKTLTSTRSTMPVSTSKPSTTQRSTTKTSPQFVKTTTPTIISTTGPSETIENKVETSETQAMNPTSTKTTQIVTTELDIANMTSFKTTEVPDISTVDITTKLYIPKIKESNLTGFMVATSATKKQSRVTTYKPKYPKLTTPKLTTPKTRTTNFITPKTTTLFAETMLDTTKQSSTLPTSATSVKTTRQRPLIDLDYTFLDISATESVSSTSQRSSEYETTMSHTIYAETGTTSSKSDDIERKSTTKSASETTFAPTTKVFKITTTYATPTETTVQTTKNKPYDSLTTLKELEMSTQSGTLATTDQSMDTTEMLRPTTATSSQQETLSTSREFETTIQSMSTLNLQDMETMSTETTITNPTTTATKQTTATDGFVTDSGNKGKPVSSRPSNIDFDQDDIFGTVKIDTKPTKPSRMQTTTESDIASELFGNERKPKVLDFDTIVPKGTKIIFSNFYEASTAPSPKTIEQETQREVKTLMTSIKNVTKTEDETNVTEKETQETTTSTKPLTSQSYLTSISFEVNKKNMSTIDQNSTNNTTSETTINDFTTPETKSPTQSMNVTTETSSQDTKKTFDQLALQLINHAKSIDYLNGNKNKTNRAKYKRRKIYVPKNRRLKSRKEN